MTRDWYFQVMGQEIGPLSVGELKAKVANGQIQPDTLVRKTAEGKWIFGGKVKGLFAVPEKPPLAPVAPPPVAKPKSSAALPIMSGSAARPKPGSSAEIVARSGSSSPPSSSATIPATHFTLVEEEIDSQPPSVEFYSFVGFREAISPVLYDAVKQFVSDRGITMSQLNRRALANFIQRPELASDLMITAVAALPQHVNDKSNRDGSRPLSDRERTEFATFRFTLFNSSHHSIQVGEGVFIPETIEERSYDTVTGGQHPPLDHVGHVPVRLSPLTTGKAIRMTLDVTVPPQATRDISVWFYANSKPSLTKVRGQLFVGHDGELAMSELFTIILHGDSPSPSF
jgi:uncharacterized protein DUF4339